MNTLLEGLASRQGGVFTRRQALECGYSEKVIKNLVRTGQWIRIRRGAYIAATLAATLDKAGKYRARIHAVMLALEKTAVVSHTSAIALHGLPLWNVDMHRVHVTRSEIRGGRLEAGVIHHRSTAAADHVMVVDRLYVTTPARAVIETASVEPFAASVVIADAALNNGATDVFELNSMLDTMRNWPGASQAAKVLDAADGRAESPAETRLRLLLTEHGLPPTELQLNVCDKDGALVGRVDLAYPERDVLVEFDGLYKFGLGPGTPGDVLAAEKDREDGLREQHEVVRVVWSDLDDGDRTAARVRAAMTRAAARRIWRPARAA